MHREWPTFAETEALARQASALGLRLRMDKRRNGWSWIWRHEESGIEMDGQTTAAPREVAFVIALMRAPVIGH